jgi:hypothetical protein
MSVVNLSEEWPRCRESQVICAPGRRFESRRSRKTVLQMGMLCCRTRRGATSHGQELARKPVRDNHFKRNPSPPEFAHEVARRPHEKAGGQAVYALAGFRLTGNLGEEGQLCGAGQEPAAEL